VDDQPGANGAIERVVGERGRILEQARGQPVVVLDETIGQIHGGAPRLAGQHEAARGMEVDCVGRDQTEVARLVGEPARRHGESAAERAGERLDGVVAGLEAGIGDAGAAP
jgi:hypothetical protein